MSAGTRSSAMTAQAPACSAIFACSGVTTSMITPPFNISARPVLTLKVARSAIPIHISWTTSQAGSRHPRPAPPVQVVVRLGMRAKLRPQRPLRARRPDAVEEAGVEGDEPGLLDSAVLGGQAVDADRLPGDGLAAQNGAPRDELGDRVAFGDLPGTCQTMSSASSSTTGVDRSS